MSSWLCNRPVCPKLIVGLYVIQSALHVDHSEGPFFSFKGFNFPPQILKLTKFGGYNLREQLRFYDIEKRDWLLAQNVNGTLPSSVSLEKLCCKFQTFG